MIYHTIMWSELKLDVYCGKKCDESRPQWETFCEGDMDSDTSTEDIRLTVDYFPPGTKVLVKIPQCPDCTLPRMTNATRDGDGKLTVLHESKCECGFNWVSWEQDKYS